MKIEVDFVRAEQHWDPDSGEQQNYLVFAFAGKEFSVAVEEADIVAAVRGVHVAPTIRLEDAPLKEEIDEELDRVFGGEAMDTSALPTAEPQAQAPRPLSAQEQRRVQIKSVMPHNEAKARLDALRKKAQERPMRTVRATDGGYPDVEVKVTTMPVDTKTASTGTDDDGFEPG